MHRILGPLAIRWIVVICVYSMPLGCHSPSDSATPSAQPSSANSTPDPTEAEKRPSDNQRSAPPATVPASAPRADQTAQLKLDGSGPIIHRPQDDGWTTEAWTEAADDQLHHLSDLLIAQESLTERDVADLIAESFICQPLLPAELEKVYEDKAIVVRRLNASDGATKAPATGLRDASGFVQALNGLLAPLKGATDKHCKFKVFRLEPSGNRMQTTILVQFSGKASGGHLQQSASWQCDWIQPSPTLPPRLLSITVSDYERTESKLPDGPLFADCTEAILGAESSYRDQLAPGLDHWLRRLEVGPSIVATSYHGLAVGDVNGDGLDDLYVCQPGGLNGGLPNRLYLQQADGTARDASAESGVDWLIETPSALIIDLDNDGDQDLVAATMAGVIFAANDGQGRFRPQALKVLPEAPPIALAAADYDLDGDLDLYAGCYASRAATQLVGRPVPYHDANNGARNALLRNDGNWQFTNVTKAVGLDENNRRFTMACAWEDCDNDGDVDLYVANDFGRNNLYRNDRGQFKDVAAELGVEDISAGMSVSWGDYNRDGWMDLYVSNMWSSAGNRVAYQRRFLNQSADAQTLASFQRHARGNSLFANLGTAEDGGFRDVSVEAAVTMGRWAWSSRMADINNDGWDDILVANGYITQDDTGDL